MNLTIEHITKKYGKQTVLDDVSITISNGILGLLGANGAGKTTLIKLLCTLSKATEGRILLDTVDIYQLKEKYRDLLGYLPQEFGYYPDYSALDFLLYISALKGIPKKDAKEACIKVLRLVNLEDVMKKKLRTFSGGMIRRLGIAQAILNDPKILILDEPSTGLDIKERVKLRNILSKLSKDRIIILSTHIVSDIEYTANSIMVLRKGTVIASGNLEQVISKTDGYVWELTVPGNDIEKLQQIYSIINMKNMTNGICIRVLSKEKPSPQAIPVPPTLEDFYLLECKEEDNDVSFDNYGI